MAFYCNGKKGVCDTYPVCKRSCEYFDNSGGKHIDDLAGKRIKTNADCIRAMSDEELAWELMTWMMETEAKHHGVESNYPNTQAKILEWLKQPAEVSDG